MASVTIDTVYKNYGKTEVVHGLSLDIMHNEFGVLVGPSGCGKSTMLRMIAGLEDITAGEISIGDTVVNHVEPKNRNIAMVFQNYALYPHMTVFKNISFGLRAAKLPPDQVTERVQAAAEVLGLQDLLLRKPSELSGGQRQRVAMGRAIVRDPQVFLFDEPLSNLDAKLRHQMRAEIKKLHHKVKTTVIYVTHDQIEAMTLADRIVVMRDGYIQQIGAPRDVYHDPANTFVAGFIGSPAMNMMPGEVVTVDGASQVRVGDTRLTIPVHQARALQPGRRVIVGVRPEDLTLDDGADAGPEPFRTPGHITLVEPLGSETLVAVDIAGFELTGIAKGRAEPATGSTADFLLNMPNLHLFDAETDLSIR